MHSHFARKEFIAKESNKLFLKLKTDRYLQSLHHTDFCRKLSFHFNEINQLIHLEKEMGEHCVLFLMCFQKELDIACIGKNLMLKNTQTRILVDLMAIMPR